MDSTLAACRGTDTDLFYDPDRLADALATTTTTTTDY